jgi:GDP-D-mannose 3',5'-epimerase
MSETRVCVTGAAGFIGHHLCRYLKERGYWVRAVDYRLPEYPVVADEKYWQCDLRFLGNALSALVDVDEVYALAADMGGMGFISFNHYTILDNNLRINLNTARVAAQAAKVQRILYTSSACVYPERLQLETEARELTEHDAWKGRPDTAYGVEKLTSESIYRRMAERMGVKVRIARFHNMYGTEGAWTGGREKAPAALCRKVAEAKLSGDRSIDVWGDGKQTRSYCCISDCLEMLYRLMRSDYREPLNIGTDRAVSVNELIDIISAAAGVEVEKEHDLNKPQGVRGRNADLSQMREVLGYEPQTSLEDGIGELYEWIENKVRKARG